MRKVKGAERPLYFAVFGPLRAWRGDAELTLGPARQRAVLAALLLDANRPVGRERLVEAVWGDPAPAYAVNQLQKYVSALRRVLEPGRAARAPSQVLEWSGSGYVLHVDEEGLDLAVFERAAARGREALARGDVQEAAARFAEALDLCTGPPLADVSSTRLDGERDRLTQLRTAVLEERIEADLRLGRHGRLVPELTRLTAEFPLRERFASLLMLALFRSGRQAEALAVYDTTRGVLRDELGVDPGPELRERHRQILTNDPAPTLAPDDVVPAPAPVTPPVTAPVLPAPRRPEAAEELALRLDDARRMQIKAGDEARAAYALVFWLLEMVNSLQERVDRLESERTPALRDEIAASRDRLSTARSQLAQARRERERAEEIRLATRRMVEERLHAREAARLPAADASDDERPAPEGDGRPASDGERHPASDAGQRPATAEDFGLAPLYEVDHALETSEERIRQQSSQLDALRAGLRLPDDADGTGGPGPGGPGGSGGPAGPGSDTGERRPAVVRGSLADPTPPTRPDTPATRSKRLPGRLLAALAVLALLTPLSAYERHTSGLRYDMSNLPAGALPAQTGDASTPSYHFGGISPLTSQQNDTEDLWSTFVPGVPSPVIAFERRLTARLMVSAAGQKTDAFCSDPLVAGVVWTLVLNGDTEIASGTLSFTEDGGDSAKIDRDLPAAPRTLTLTASSSSDCGFTMRLQKPLIRFRGLWGPA